VRFFKRKSQLQRVLASVNKSLVPVGKKLGLPGRFSDKTWKAGLIAAGGITGLTAGSAGISSLRRRTEGSRDDS
jgi:hypothetical protein